MKCEWQKRYSTESQRRGVGPDCLAHWAEARVFACRFEGRESECEYGPKNEHPLSSPETPCP